MWQIRWILVCVLTACIDAELDNFDELLLNSKVFAEFQQQLALQQREIVKLTNELTEQKQENIVLRRTVEKLESRLDAQEASPENATQTTSSNGKSEQTIGQRSSEYFKRAPSTSRQVNQVNQADVAFSAALTHPVLHIGSNQNIVFDNVQTNIGNGYNAHHGVFIAPVPGTYVFYSSILSGNHNREIYCRFVVNGAQSYTIYGRGTDGRHDQGSNMIIVQLNQGDDVTVQNLAPDDDIFSDSNMYSTFSGFLLRGVGEVIVG